MKTRTLLFAALACAVLALPAGAQTVESVFKVKLLGGMEILSSTAPMQRGSMLLFKNLSDGSLTSVPAELVTGVSKARASNVTLAARTGKAIVPASRLVTMADSATRSKSVVIVPTRSVSLSKTQASLVPSLTGSRPVTGNATTIFLGPTGGASTAAARANGTLVTARGDATTTTRAFAAAPLAASIQDQIFVGDLPRGTPRGLMAGGGLEAGMVTPTAGEVTVGSNGFPVPVTATTPATAPIGPNGFPDFGAAAARTPPVGPNGFPVTAPAALNGFPVTGIAPATVPATSRLTPVNRSTGIPLTFSPVTALTTGSINVPATGTAAPATGAAPAAASPR